MFSHTYSYSVVNGRSGIQDTQTSFIGCDHGKVDYIYKIFYFCCKNLPVNTIKNCSTLDHFEYKVGQAASQISAETLHDDLSNTTLMHHSV